MKYLSNAFSLQMLNINGEIDVHVAEVDVDYVRDQQVVSVIGHQDTANVLATMLNYPVPMNRQSIQLTAEDELIVAQVIGGRLPEGSTTLPEGFKLKFYKVMVG